MTELKLHSFVILVKDIGVSKRFYQGILSQEVEMDFGKNIGFKSGLALWEKGYAQNIIFGSNVSSSDDNRNLEVYFETDNLPEIYDKVTENKVEVIHDIREQPWGQRVFRIFDPDGFIIEIAESMMDVVRRLIGDGISKEAVSEKTMMPQEAIEAILKS
ncbi:MAG: VOC family protein [Halobacteriota archaeon]|nr:VOC family protein [Halobacteriota archaeon]